MEVVAGLIVCLVGAVCVMVLVIAVVVLMEGIRAFKETSERQRYYHPDPEAERAVARQLVKTRKAEDRRKAELCVMKDRYPITTVKGVAR